MKAGKRLVISVFLMALIPFTLLRSKGVSIGNHY
jgi:hypothetical protein